MDYKEFVEHPDFSSYAKVAEWVATAAISIAELLARAEAAENRAENAEKCIVEIEEALKFWRNSAAMLRRCH